MIEYDFGPLKMISLRAELSWNVMQCNESVMWCEVVGSALYIDGRSLPSTTCPSLFFRASRR